MLRLSKHSELFFSNLLVAELKGFGHGRPWNVILCGGVWDRIMAANIRSGQSRESRGERARIYILRLLALEAVSQYRSWFESLTTNGIRDCDIKYLPVRPDPSTGSGLKAVEGACPEAPRRVEGFRANCDTVSSRGRQTHTIWIQRR